MSKRRNNQSPEATVKSWSLKSIQKARVKSIKRGHTFTFAAEGVLYQRARDENPIEIGRIPAPTKKKSGWKCKLK